MNWLFVVILLFLVFMAIYGYTKGIMRMLFSVAAFFVSVLAMVILAPFVSDMLIKCEPVMSRIKTPVYDVVIKQLEKGVDADEILEEFHLPQNINSSIEKYVQENVQEKEDLAANAVSQYIAEYICRILSYFIIFIMVRILLQIISCIINLFEHLPVIKKLNNIGGLALALIEAFGCIWLFFMIADVLHATQFGIVIRTLIWDNEILRLLYNKNPLLIFMK